MSKSHELVKQQSMKGHNSDEELRKYVERFTQMEIDRENIGGRQKDLLNEAKKSGFLKTSIRKAVKTLRSSMEQRQSATEVERATKEYVEICSDLPLFKQASGATDEAKEAVGK
ncbi:GapR family DNA-binding domain-containing protein [uncultured Paraglaciecola sp.]|uniref:GapR family DNA-binding domain-containing protein n=1 Tax=uncultured Paraglaciecola sp. TaxID=1765024 RepID=UPI00262648B1|nr:GapR family DNA-binding domain-containing protein [uncultured Paraglaciecola sp.]